MSRSRKPKAPRVRRAGAVPATREGIAAAFAQANIERARLNRVGGTPEQHRLLDGQFAALEAMTRGVDRAERIAANEAATLEARARYEEGDRRQLVRIVALGEELEAIMEEIEAELEPARQASAHASAAKRAAQRGRAA